MIITCPQCQTRYRVASDALSAAGRQVQCANCSTLWVATPSFPKPGLADPEPDDDELGFRADKDTLFTDADETLSDLDFARDGAAAASGQQPEAEQRPNEKAKEKRKGKKDKPPAPRPRDRGINAELMRERIEDIAIRRNAIISGLPVARFRRSARILIGLVIVAGLGLAVTLRTEIVRAYPQFDSLYRLVGLGTNVIGLDFADLKTLRTTRDGNPVIIVTAKISNITNRVAFVPNVLVSLLDAEERVVYEWSVTPAARNILPGDVLGIDTQLTSPPASVETVRLGFVETGARIAPEL